MTAPSPFGTGRRLAACVFLSQPDFAVCDRKKNFVNSNKLEKKSLNCSCFILRTRRFFATLCKGHFLHFARLSWGMYVYGGVAAWQP